jgi:hypothetical protein
VRAFFHRGDAFFVPCVLFPTVGALFPLRARFFRFGRKFLPGAAWFLIPKSALTDRGDGSFPRH